MGDPVKSVGHDMEPKEIMNTQPDIERVATTSSEIKGSATAINPDDVGYHRSLTRRKVMMMTFGAGIGTGLWVGTGQALYYGVFIYTRVYIDTDEDSWSCWARHHLYSNRVGVSPNPEYIANRRLASSFMPNTLQSER